MANPIMAFLAFFVPMSKPRYISLCTFIGIIFGGFLLCTALTSPDMLLGQEVGGALTVSSLKYRYWNPNPDSHYESPN